MSGWLGDVGEGAAKGAAIGATVGTVVPGLGNAVGAVAGGAIGGVAGLLGNLFPDTAGKLLANAGATDVAPVLEAVAKEVTGADTPGAVTAALAADPELGKTLETRLQTMVRLEEIAAADRAGARGLQSAAIAAGNTTADKLARLILVSFLGVALLILVGCGILISGVAHIRASPEVLIAVSSLIGAIVGYFSANAQQVVSFYFGASSTNAAQQDQIGGLINKALRK